MLAIIITIVGLVISSFLLGGIIGIEIMEKRHKKAREIKEIVLPPFFK